MKKLNLYYIIIIMIVFQSFLFSQENLKDVNDWGDETSWKNAASSGNWNADNWYNNTQGWDNHNPNYEGGRRLLFDNNNQLTMINDFTGDGTKRWQIIFTANANQSRTISGNTSNTFYDNSGIKPKIENLSNINHTISFPITIGYNPLELVPTNGNLTFTSEIVTQGNFIDVFGPNQKVLEITSNITGNGGLSIKQNSTVILSTINKTYNGVTTIEAGTLELQGSIASSAVTVQNGATLKINGDNVTVASLTVESGGNVEIVAGKSLTVSGNLSNSGTFTIKSDVSGTGSLIVNGTFTGDVTVERYIEEYTAAANGWHLLSSPVATFNINDNSTIDPGANDDFYGWSEPAYTWMNHKQGDPSQMVPGTGYLIAYETTAIKEFSGTLNSAAVPYNNLSKTTGQGEGWHLVGNPFQSAITWNAPLADWGLTNINGTAKVMTNTGGFNDLSAGDHIAAMQGFWIQAEADANNSFTIPLTARDHNAAAWLKASENNAVILAANDLESGMMQKSWVRFNQDATETYDTKYDSRFMAWLAPQFYSIIEDEKLSTNTYPQLDEIMVIPFGFEKNEASNFSIELLESPEDQTIYLTDNKTGGVHNFTDTPTYSFTASSGDSPDRFLLHFGVVGIGEQDQATTLHAYAYNNRLYVNNSLEKAQLAVYDLQGRLLMQQSANASGLQSLPLDLPAGVYVVRLSNAQEAKSVKINVQ